MGYRITVSDEREMLLETGGGLFKARNFFNDDPFLLYNADIITDMNISILYDCHLKKKGLATLAVRHREGVRYYLVNEEGLLRGWINKSTGEKILTGPENEVLHEIAFSSIHIINPEIFRHMTQGIYTMTALYLQLASSQNIYTCLFDGGYWANVGTPEILREIRNMLEK